MKIFQVSINANLARVFVFIDSEAYDRDNDGEQIAEVDNDGDITLKNPSIPEIGLLTPSMLFVDSKTMLRFEDLGYTVKRRVVLHGISLSVINPITEIDGMDLNNSVVRRIRNGNIVSFSRLSIFKKALPAYAVFCLKGLLDSNVFCTEQGRDILTNMWGGFEFYENISTV
jgi:hypothetical protein